MIDDFKRPPQDMRARLEAARSSNEPQPAGPYIEQVKVERPTPSFRTPEEVAASGFHEFGAGPNGPELPAPLPSYGTGDEQQPMIPESGNGKSKKERPPKGPAKTILLFGKWRVPQKEFIIWLIVILLIILSAGAGAYYKLVMDKPEPAKTVTKTQKAAPPPPPPIVSPLTGLTVDDKAKQTWPVIGVMVENSPNARPQSGLKHAGVVFEAIAEYGVTRFLALYQEDRPDNIGPIRSARPYYLDWAMAFDASYAHVGGSPDALARIKSIGTKDMDQFFNPSAYHRITQRYAPHNVYTGAQQLADLSASKGWTSSQFTALPRKADRPFVAPAATAPAQQGSTSTSTSKKTDTDSRTPATSAAFAISGAFYNVAYDYHATTNTYLRMMGGAAHLDADTKTQVQPKVVVALVMPYSLMADGYHSQYNTVGTGKMFVFQDGTVTTGTWTKGEPKSQFEFKDETGAPLKLNAGQTWFTVVGDAGKVTYK